MAKRLCAARKTERALLAHLTPKAVGSRARIDLLAVATTKWISVQ
jgi:hypothetical protein